MDALGYRVHAQYASHLHYRGDGRLRHLIGAHFRGEIGGQFHVAHTGQSQQREALGSQREVIQHQWTAQTMQRHGHSADLVSQGERGRRIDFECDRPLGQRGLDQAQLDKFDEVLVVQRRAREIHGEHDSVCVPRVRMAALRRSISGGTPL